MTPRILAAVALVSCVFAYGAAPPARPAPELPLPGVVARSIGPATMSGRITSIAVVEKTPNVQYLGAASGGVWKTTDDGLTWSCVFEGRPLASVGAVAVSQSDPDVVYAGMGEANARNSVSWGNGVFVSRDAGKTWKHAGLAATQHIGKIVVHPSDPDVAYVAALGRVWAPNKERGVFMTKDGGKSWDHVLAIDEDTGAIDLRMEPGDPQTLYAALYAVRRDGFSGGNPEKQFSTKAGLYRSRDGGKKWTKLTKGLPDRAIGRCGIDVYRKDPGVIYAVVQTDKTDIRVVAGQKATDWKKGGLGPVETGGIFRSADRGDTWVKINDLCPRPFYFSQIRVDPTDDTRLWVLGIPLFYSSDGGKNFRSAAGQGVHVDHHDLWINPADPKHVILGNDGGLYYTQNTGQSWTAVKNLPISQFYMIGLDMQDPYRVYGGLQDNGSWGGPSRTDNPAGILNKDWTRVLGADGFHCQVPPDDPSTVYAEGQYGKLSRIDLRAKRTTAITPKMQNETYRFNWSAPLILSAHDSKTLYYGGNALFKTTDRGATWKRISEDLTHGKFNTKSASTGHTLTTIAESPLQPGVVYVGSDDGRIHVTQNDGKTWTDLSAKVPKLPRDRHVTRLECSPYAAETVFLSVSRHRNDDREPYVYRSDDFGQTWKSIASDLPSGGPVHVIRQDPKNKDLLYAGTELGLYVSFDAGGSWQRLRQGLPHVPVHDVVVHPRALDLVVATHGRGIYVLDAMPLQELTAKVREQKAHLFTVREAALKKPRQPEEAPSRTYAGVNPPDGLVIHYYLREKGEVTLEVADSKGKQVVKLEAAGEAGVNRAVWDLKRLTDKGPEAVEAGEYVVRLTHDGKASERKVRVKGP